MKILILGGTGMLGHKLVQELKKDFDVWVTIRGKFIDFEPYKIFEKDRTFEQVTVTKTEKIKKIIKQTAPDVVINCIGVIKQLPVSMDVINTLQVNSIFPHQLAQFAAEYGFRLINISTDCVFNGDRGNYTEEDVPDATDLYGKSKNLGEVLQENCLTIRTSIIGRELNTKHSLVEWFLSNEGSRVRGFKNAVYTGFPTIVFAGILRNLIKNYPRLEGLYHISSEPINKFDLLELIKKNYGANIEIEPFEEFKIDRSLNSGKFRSETGFVPLKWAEMIEKMAGDVTPYYIWNNWNNRNK